MRFGFIITARCNASCTHCTVSSGPRNTTSLGTDAVTRLMDEAAALWRRERIADEGLLFSISGGEPFLDFPRLLALVAHGSGLGATMTCVTNGAWASTEATTRAKLQALKDAGLYAIAVSTSRFHQQYVKVARVQHVIDVGRAVGIKTVLKCAVTAGEGSRRRWARSRGADSVEIFPVMPYLREGARLPEDEYIRRHGLPSGRCPGATITVREDGSAYTCCMPGAFNEFLKLGSVYNGGLAPIHDAFYLQGKQQVLRYRGPAHFARAIRKRGLGHLLRGRYEGVCDLCAHIGSEPRLAAVAEAVSRKFGERSLRAERARVERETAAVG